MTDQTTPFSPLSPRHERFVLEFLKDGNATQAYIRAGYSRRGAQPSASRLLRQPRVEAAIAAGQGRVARALEVSIERLGREYARIAFANIDDYIYVETDGRLRIDLEKASKAQRAGIVELKIANHSKPEQRVTLRLGKLRALDALTRRIGLFARQPEPARDAARAALAAVSADVSPSARAGQGPRTAAREMEDASKPPAAPEEPSPIKLKRLAPPDSPRPMPPALRRGGASGTPQASRRLARPGATSCVSRTHSRDDDGAMGPGALVGPMANHSNRASRRIAERPGFV